MVAAQTQPLAARLVGPSVMRKEDRRLVTGHGRYVDDITLHGQLHLAFRRSESPAGKYRQHRHVGRRSRGRRGAPSAPRRDLNPRTARRGTACSGRGLVTPPPLADQAVKYVGDPIACVVATSRYLAEDACDLIEVDYEATPAVVDYRSAAADTEHLVHGDWGLTSNAMVDSRSLAVSPDLEDAFAAAAHVVEADDRAEPLRRACPMETTRDQRLVGARCRRARSIYVAGQSTHGTRDYYARYLGIPAASITVEIRDVGGGFGQKMFVFREENAVVLASRRPRPSGEVDRGPAGEPDGRAPLPQRVGPRPPRRRRRRDSSPPSRASTRADIGAYPMCPAVMNTALLPGPVQDPPAGLLHVDGVDQHHGQGRLPRSMDVRDDRAGDADRPRRPRARASIPSSCAAATSSRPAPARSPSPTGQRVRRDHTARDARAGRRDARLRRLPGRAAAARAEGRYLGRGVLSCLRRAHHHGRRPRWSPEGCTVRVEQRRPRHRLPRHHVARPVDRDDDGPGGGRCPRRRVRGRHRRAGHHARDARRPAAPAGAARRPSPVVPPPGRRPVRDKVLAIAAHLMEASADDLRDGGAVGVGEGHPDRVDDAEGGGRPSLYTDPIGAAAAGIEPSLEATVASSPTASRRGPTPPTCAWWRSTPSTWAAEDPALHRERGLRPDDQPHASSRARSSAGWCRASAACCSRTSSTTTTATRSRRPSWTTCCPPPPRCPIIEVGHIETVSTINPGGFKGMGEGGAIGAHAAVANAVADALHHLGVRVTSTPLGPNDIFELVRAAGVVYRRVRPLPAGVHPRRQRRLPRRRQLPRARVGPLVGARDVLVLVLQRRAQARLLELPLRPAEHRRRRRRRVRVRRHRVVPHGDAVLLQLRQHAAARRARPARLHLPEGERFEMLDPLEHYRITFADRDSIHLDLDWRAVGKPWVRVGPSPTPTQGDQTRKPRHLDQFGHVTGNLLLHGETIPIDCYAMRDQSWWHLRPEQWNGAAAEHLHHLHGRSRHRVLRRRPRRVPAARRCAPASSCRARSDASAMTSTASCARSSSPRSTPTAASSRSWARA